MVIEKLGISENLKWLFSGLKKFMEINTILEMWLKSQDMSVVKKKRKSCVIIFSSKLFNWLEMNMFNLQNKSISKNALFSKQEMEVMEKSLTSTPLTSEFIHLSSIELYLLT